MLQSTFMKGKYHVQGSNFWDENKDNNKNQVHGYLNGHIVMVVHCYTSILITLLASILL